MAPHIIWGRRNNACGWVRYTYIVNVIFTCVKLLAGCAYKLAGFSTPMAHIPLMYPLLPIRGRQCVNSTVTPFTQECSTLRRQPLWQLLVERGVFPDRDTAVGWVMAGCVLVNNQRIDKPGTLVARDANIRVKGLDMPFVGRGGIKLSGALDDLAVDVAGCVALDTGASTGGFTDCLLQRGARKVYAIDVGYGQLVGKLRADPRVVNMERTNIGDVRPDALIPLPTIATVDLSYLSLRKALPIITKLVAPDSTLVCLVKPLFEVDDPQARRTGRLDPAVYPDLLGGLVDFAEQLGLSVAGVVSSRIQGSHGTREFFLKIHTTAAAQHCDMRAQIAYAVQSLIEEKAEA